MQAALAAPPATPAAAPPATPAATLAATLNRSKLIAAQASSNKGLWFGIGIAVVLVVGAVVVYLVFFRNKDSEAAGSSPTPSERTRLQVEYMAKNDTGATAETARTVAHTGSLTDAVPLTLTKVNTINKAWVVQTGGSMQMPDAFDPGPAFTLLVWVKPDDSAYIKSIAANSGGGYQTNGFRIFWNTWTADALGNDRAINVEVGNGTEGSVLKSSGPVMVANQWRMVGVTFDRANTKMQLFVDGAMVAESTAMTFDAKTSGPWMLGAFADGAVSAVGSSFAAMAFHKSVLTAAEIKAQYDQVVITQ